MAGIGEKPLMRSGPYLLDRVDVGRGDDLLRLLELRRAGSRPCRARAGSGAASRGRPGSTPRPSTGSSWRLARLAPQVEERPAHVGVLHADRAVEVPGEGDAALAAARLVGREAAVEQRVVERLHLPGDDPLLDVDVPGAAAGAVDAVGRAHDLVVLPAVPVELLPGARLRADEVLDPLHEAFSWRGRGTRAGAHAAQPRRPSGVEDAQRRRAAPTPADERQAERARRRRLRCRFASWRKARSAKASSAVSGCSAKTLPITGKAGLLSAASSPSSPSRREDVGQVLRERAARRCRTPAPRTAWQERHGRTRRSGGRRGREEVPPAGHVLGRRRR